LLLARCRQIGLLQCGQLGKRLRARFASGLLLLRLVRLK